MSSSPSKRRYKKQVWWMRLLHQRLPITRWLPEYNSEKAVADFIAGVTVGLTLIPQALAYATLAGLEPQYGLYSSILGCFVYVVFGSCKDITLGPTALMSLMTYQQIQERNADYAFLLCFLTGVVQMLMGILHLGVLIDFISVPVTVGFTSATSVIIAVSQIKGLLGLKFKSNGFIDNIRQVCINLPNAQMSDSLLGVICIIVLLLMRKMKDLTLHPNRKGLKKTLWLLSTSRNAIVVIVTSIAAFVLKEVYSMTPFQLTGAVRAGLPPVSLPPFSTTLGGRQVSFVEMVSDLGSSVVLVPVIGVLGNVALAKAFAASDPIDATQELFTLSISNILGSFLNAIPITGSFSRSAVNHASGVATQFGSVYTGILVVLALSLLTPYFYFIPKAALAAVIISAVIFMIEYEVIKPMWRSRRADLVTSLATFALSLLVGVELGILAGVTLNVLVLLYPSARPRLEAEIVTTTSGFSYVLVTVGNSLYFPAVEYIRQYVERAAHKQGDCCMPVVIDCTYVLGADYTAAKGLCSLSHSLRSRGQQLVVLAPRGDVTAVFKGARASVAVVQHREQLDAQLIQLTGHIPLSTLNEAKDITPPPSYTSLAQHDDVIQVVIPDEPNTTPLLANRKYNSEVNDT